MKKLKLRFPIYIQISIFLVLVAFIPVAAMMMLKTYESQMLTMMENSNVQQARIISASLELTTSDSNMQAVWQHTPATSTRQSATSTAT